MIYVSFFLGLLMICKGGDWFVGAASYMAEVFGVPKYVVGATIVSFATTMPEMIVSMAAALRGKSVMAVGNAVGSVSANTGLILGISLLCLPSAIRRKEYFLKNVLYIGSLALLWVSFRDGLFDRLDCIFLLLAGILFLIINVQNAFVSREERIKEKTGKKELGKRALLFAAGAAAIVTGAHLLVQSACEIARVFRVPENVISVTILAMGTSLPEMITTIAAILKRESSLSVGNIVGANMIDTAFILPVCTLITGRPLAIPASAIYADVPACLAVSAIALVPMLVRGKIRRMDGLAAMAVYGLYLLFLL